jgi:DNA-directed RNA polymerase beta' subunit
MAGTMEEVQQVEKVSFSLFSPEEVRRLGSFQITTAGLDLSEQSPELYQSLRSPLMGPVQMRMKCTRCHLSSPNCIGHFAYIEFPTRTNGEKVYVLHNELMPIIFKTVQCACQSCGTPLLNPRQVENAGFNRLRGAKRLDAIAKESEKQDACHAVIKTAEGDKLCGHPNPRYFLGRDKDRGNFIRYYVRGDGKKPALEDMAKLTPAKIRDIFRLLAIDPSALEMLGFAPGILPENMVLENLLVLPTSYRPPRVLNDKVSHNDLTHLYAEILRVCNAINKHNLSPDAEEKDVGLLFTYVSTLFNNSSGAYHYTNGNNRPHRTLTCLMKGKGRLIRGYTQGKRVNFCIRSVASPNPRLRLRQVGIPRSLAQIVTYPEWVDETNYERLQRYVDTGLAVMLTKAQGKMKDRPLQIVKLIGERASLRQLEMGDKVDRHMMGPRHEDGVFFEGDYVLVNRQPTLHKESMLGMEVVIVEEETIQLSVNACAPFGLDFDGDEMNVHVPQTREAQAETRGRMSFTQSIVSPQHNRPVVGLTQESMTNAYLLTKEGVIVSRANFQQILTSTFPDLDTAEITNRITSLFRRLERTRAEKFAADGTPYHQHLIDNAVRVRMADLYQSFGAATASTLDGSSSSSCTPPSSELRSYQNRARDVVAERYWQERFATRGGDELGFDLEERKEPEDYQSWLRTQFARVDQKSALALELAQKLGRDRIINERERREQMADLRRRYKDSEDADEKVAIVEELKELKAVSEADKPSDVERAAENYARVQYDKWLVSAAKITDADVQRTVESMVRREEEDRHYVTGRELFSILYPEDYFYSHKNGADPLEPVVRVEEGIHVEGQHNKGTLGATHGSIIGDLFKMYSPEHAEELISRAKWLTDNWASSNGMSLTLYSCQTLDPSFNEMMRDKIKAAKIDAFKLGPRSNNPLEEARRQEILSETFRNVKGMAGKCAMERMTKAQVALGPDGKPLLNAQGQPIMRPASNPDNPLVVMATSGSKGNKENISSIMTMVGQQEFQGQPIPLLPGGRSVPSFERNSREPGARGFVEHDYLTGMTPAEFFLHQYAAREGLFGTALKTAETGYMQRRILKAMEDAVVYPDNTVRNAQGVVIQYAYGEDGFSGDRLVMTKGRARFIDAKRLLSIIQSRRRRGLPPMYKPLSEPLTRELPRPGYLMPNFEEPRRTTVVAEEEEAEEDEEKKDEDEEGKEPDEELDEGGDGSDLSEGEMPEEED